MKQIAFVKVVRSDDGTYSAEVYDDSLDYFATVTVDRSIMLALQSSAPYVLELEGRGVLS